MNPWPWPTIMLTIRPVAGRPWRLFGPEGLCVALDGRLVMTLLPEMRCSVYGSDIETGYMLLPRYPHVCYQRGSERRRRESPPPPPNPPAWAGFGRASLTVRPRPPS